MTNTPLNQSFDAQSETKQPSVVLAPATLYIVPTPIGNLTDITYRALAVLKQVDLIAAEDTRQTGYLLSHFAIKNKMVSMHNYNENHKLNWFIEQLSQGKSVALVSDAGTPLISDPGYPLVAKCHELGFKVIPLPGACACITALSGSGLSAERFTFMGFIPAKSKARCDLFQSIKQSEQTVIFYESPHRITDSLADMLQVLGPERIVVLARELTKTYETIHGAPLDKLNQWVLNDPNQQRGEMVLIVASAPKEIEPQVIPAPALEMLTLLCTELPLKKASTLVAQFYKLKKNDLYQWGIDYIKNV